LLLFVLSPFLVFLVKKPFKLLQNIIKVFLGKLSIVGFTPSLTAKELEHLPKIKKGILSPLDIIPKNLHKDTNILKINQLYAKDYQVKNDFSILLKGLKKLDN
jgi:lipopolysaccharide/colanic/teichoic acid biosynthesis glycosyltransferase